MRKYPVSRAISELWHVDEVLKLLSVMTHDNRYEEILNTTKEVHTMCDVAERLVNQGITKGISEGISQGISEGIIKGQNDLVSAVEALRSGKTDVEILALGIDQRTLDLAKCIK